MSRIFEALKHAQMLRADKGDAKPAAAEVPEVPERRKSRRWTRDIRVYVYGRGPGTNPFHEEAHTLNVSANGARLLLSVPVQKGQQLLLINQETEREQDCRIIFLGAQHTRTVEAGVEFSAANLDFWHIPKTPSGPPGQRER